MIAIASDHGGYLLKEHIKAYLAAKGITCEDFGTDSTESCDYPIFAKAAAEAVASGRCERGQQGPGDPLCPLRRCALRRDDPPP